MEAIAAYYAARLRVEAPFIERVVGMSRPRTTYEPNSETAIRVTLPLPVEYTASECATTPRYLVPDGSIAGAAWFEDVGTTPAVLAGSPLLFYDTTLRLLLWLNTDRISPAPSETQLLAAVTRAVRPRQHLAAGDFLDVLATLTPLAANAESLFARYSFADSPLLYPPYRVAGYELKVRWRLNPDCLPPTIYPPTP